jgi:MutS domain V
LASNFFELTRGRIGHKTVDDQTWDDLEFPEIFTELDTTVTPVGSQFLYKQMRTYNLDQNNLKKLHQVYERLRVDGVLREALQLKLAPLGKDEYECIAESVYGDYLRTPRHAALIPYWGLASVLVLLAVIFWSWPLWIWLLVLGVNIFFILRTSRTLNKDVEAMTSCMQMLRVAGNIASTNTDGASLDVIRNLGHGTAGRAKASQALRGMYVLRNPLTAWVTVWFVFAFLAEIIAYIYAIHAFNAARPVFASTFELIGELDAAIAMACFLERCPNHCQPIFSKRGEFVVEQSYHPLLRNPVKNSISLQQQSALVTGSNMAGKTTFIKTLGVNAIFGQTLGVCLAERAILPQTAVLASIADRQSVASGKSHYFAEVERIHLFLDQADRDEGGVFVIDELFSGTNTIERLAVCRAVLESLGRNAIVLVTTHDVELQGLLDARYQFFHFQENPDIAGFFDYIIRPGAATERNAIRLLERVKFPVRIVADAMRYVNEAT